MYSIIDGHAHGRDLKQTHKETLAHLFNVAKKLNIVYVGLMPNTDPSLTNEETVWKYLSLVVPHRPEINFGINMGVTADIRLFRKNIEFARKNPFIKAMKLYMGESTGDLAVTDYGDQEKIFRTASEKNLSIPLMTHNEDQKCLDRNRHKWDRNRPWTWNEARPGESEILSVAHALQLYEAYPFPGGLYFCHLSCPESVNMAHRAKKKGLKVYAATTPIYLLLDTELTQNLPNKNDPLLYKVNPPIRNKQRRLGMVQCLLNGMIDVIESDHAPHTLEEKLGEKPPSGLWNFPAWPRVIKWLETGLGMSRARIKELTFDTPRKIFDLDVKGKEMDDDKLIKSSKEAIKEYGPDLFEGILV